MEYVDGGALVGWQKAVITGAIAVGGIAVLTAISILQYVGICIGASGALIAVLINKFA